jgi:hypothetical protein
VRGLKTPKGGGGWLFIATLIGVSAAYTLAPGAALAGTLDQHQDSGAAPFGEVSTSDDYAQTFTAGITGGVDRVDFFTGGTFGGTPTAPLTVQIQDVSAGAPNGAVLASQNFAFSGTVPAAAFVPINFTTPAPVVAGTQYAIVASSTTGPSNPYPWWGASGDTYTAGDPFNRAPSPPGQAWQNQGSSPPPGFDLAFRTYVAPSALGSTGRRAAALKKCKKKFERNHNKSAFAKCKKKAKKLPA